jgi:hypothetical protein
MWEVDDEDDDDLGEKEEEEDDEDDEMDGGEGWGGDEVKEEGECCEIWMSDNCPVSLNITSFSSNETVSLLSNNRLFLDSWSHSANSNIHSNIGSLKIISSTFN